MLLKGGFKKQAFLLMRRAIADAGYDRGKADGRKEALEAERGENKILRYYLWLRHGCSISALYGDDGEMQCGACGIDFKRLSVAEIERTFVQQGYRKLRDSVTGIEVANPNVETELREETP